MRMRRKSNLDKRIENCRHLLVDTSGSLKGNWLLTYGFSQLHLEIGCGKGGFITQTAKNHPEILFIAIEKTTNVLITALESAQHDCLTNVYFINSVAENLTDFFAPGEVSQIYINFCDPWPSRRHIKRRLTSCSFLKIYKEVLTPDGIIRFKTDNFPLYEFSLEEFKSCGFNVAITQNNKCDVITEYEQKFIDAGKPIYKCLAGVAG